jgi:hypothetical protein
MAAYAAITLNISVNWNTAGGTLWYEELEYSPFVEKSKLVDVSAVALLGMQSNAAEPGGRMQGTTK